METGVRGVFGSRDPGAPKSPETKEIQWFLKYKHPKSRNVEIIKFLREFAEPLGSRACETTD